MKTLEEVIAQMKSEIIGDVRCLHVPVNVANFGELHDFVDANKYGGFIDDKLVDEMIAKFGGRDPVHEGMPEEVVEFTDSAQTAVSIWIESGGLEDAIENSSWSEFFTPQSYGDLLTYTKGVTRQLENLKWRLREVRRNLENLP